MPNTTGSVGMAGPPPDGGEPDTVIQELYLAHALALVRVANLLLRDRGAAEDVVHDAFLHLYRALPRLREHDQLLPYLHAAVLNGCRSALRGRRRRAEQPAVPDPAGALVSSAEAAAILGEDRRAAFAAVAQLPRRSREVLVLRYYLDLSYSEIAAALGVSRGTVSSTVSRAVAALARELKEEA